MDKQISDAPTDCKMWMIGNDGVYLEQVRLSFSLNLRECAHDHNAHPTPLITSFHM